MSSAPATPPSSPASPAVGPIESTPPPLSSTQLPTMKAAKPPKEPTDLVPTNLVVGRVTRGGSGPCYGVMAEDGTEYAVYSAAGLSLREGATVRVRFQDAERGIDCGGGRRIRALQIVVLTR
jgi:hypothetical protein